MVKKFYVCSYGGSGSYMLLGALRKYGIAYHVHSRRPPDKLEYLGSQNGGDTYFEWFNGVPIPEEEIKDYTVLYIYKNPVKAIFSRFNRPGHLRNIETDPNVTIDDVVRTGLDLYGIYEFYNNYTMKNKNRNYKIYAIKYEEIFEKQNELSQLLGIGPLNLVKRETQRDNDPGTVSVLNEIYAPLNERMNKNDFIMIS